jgi:predicted permease
MTEAYRALHLKAAPGGRGVSRLRETYGTWLTFLLTLTTLLLLITCGNLATLLLARASARERELAVRAALGAARRRLISQMLTESLLLAACGAALAVPVAVGFSRTVVAFLSTPTNPVALTLVADWRVLTFITVVAVLTVVIFGCVPALRVSFVDARSAINRTARRLTLDRHPARIQRGLVAVQVAVSLVLIVAALMFVQTFRRLAAVDVGFAPEGLVALAFADPSAGESAPEQNLAMQQQLVQAIRAVPGVAAAAATTHIPLSGDTWSHFFRVVGGPDQNQKAARFTYVDPEYFETLGVPLLAGRRFTDADDARSRPVMIVNETFVRRHLGGRNPIGAIIDRLPEPAFPDQTLEIVGVVGDTKYNDLRNESCWCEGADGPMAPLAYVPLAQNPSPVLWSPMIVRVPSRSNVTASIVQAAQRVRPEISVVFLDLPTQIRQQLAGDRIIAWLAGAFGILALQLVIIGLHGLIAYLAVSRTNEIGIRLSLGSTRRAIVGLVLGESALMIAVGVVIGVPLAAVTMRMAKVLLFGLSPIDFPTIAVAVIGLATVAALAGAIPAWRASRLDPNVVLRAE